MEQQPTEIIEGVLENEDIKETMNITKPYIFFGGSLLPRYGVCTLIEAFKMMNRDDVDLFIAGHTGNDHQIKDAIKDNPNIGYKRIIAINDSTNWTTILHNEVMIDKIELAITAVSLVKR